MRRECEAFKTNRKAYRRSALSSADEDATIIMLGDGIGLGPRGPSVPHFGSYRMISVLRAIRLDHPMSPVEVTEASDQGYTHTLYHGPPPAGRFDRRGLPVGADCGQASPKREVTLPVDPPTSYTGTSGEEPHNMALSLRRAACADARAILVVVGRRPMIWAQLAYLRRAR
jgi:hypothetical protein